MKHRIIMGKNAKVAIAIPLYCHVEEKEIADMTVSVGQVVAYAIDFGHGNIEVVNSDLVDSHSEYLGDL